MHGSELKDGQHSTPEEDPRPKLWPRVLGSLAIVGVMVGMMIGRLTAPTPVELQQVDVLPGGLVVWFSAEPKLHGELVDGTLGLLFDARGKVQSGQLTFNGKSVNWRVRDTDGGTYEYFQGMGLGELISKVEKVDDNTVRFELTRPESPFLADLALDSRLAARAARSPWIFSMRQF